MPALIALLLTAFVMRGPVTGVGPVAAEVVAAYGTTWSLYGLLAALPVAAFWALFFSRSGASGAFRPLRSRVGCARFAAPRHCASLHCESGGFCGRHVPAGRRYCASQRAHAGRHQNALAEKNRHADGTLYRHDRAFRCGGRAHGCAAFAWGGSLSWPFGFGPREPCWR